MKHSLGKYLVFTTLTLLLTSCGGTSDIISTPEEKIDKTPIKFSSLSDSEEKEWSHLDLVNDTIPGISLNKAYDELIKRKGKTVIVAIIDSGIDIDHEDLRQNIWVNEDEIPNNGKDDDNNGYIDDIHGWNFLGGANFTRFEYVRLLATGNTNHPKYAEAKSEYDGQVKKYTDLKSQYLKLLNDIDTSDKAISKYLNKKEYTLQDINGIKTQNKSLQEHIDNIKMAFSFGHETIANLKAALQRDINGFSDRLEYHLNLNFDGRKLVGDNPNDINDTNYGNNNIKPITQERSHGTHVSGIVAAKRNNGIGINGVANNVKIMAIRNTPNGDEYDKDVALAIRYAVNNGAKVINMSFGKYYSPNSEWVRDAIAYAGEHEVVIVTGAGNEGINVDKFNNFPNDQINNGPEVSNNFINVGATEYRYGSTLVADYSNFGKINVDVFAPGTQMYSTYPSNKYEFAKGTSMASPTVAGIAALLFSQYPNLTAAQVKQIIMDSGTPINTKVVVGANNRVIDFKELSKSGKIVNAYNALLLASKISK